MKNTLLLTLVVAMTVTLTGCGQQSEPNINPVNDTTMTGTIDSGTVDNNATVDTTVTTPATDMPANTTTDNTQVPADTNIPPTNTTVTTEIPSVKSYTMADVAKHNSEASCRSAINGNVYDLGAFVSQHPGGDRNILRICGIDGTMAFEGQHGGEGRPEKTLAGFMIGVLVK